ncbi:MAG: peroxiredoxin [Planctomycetaceae bacterium]|nr:peroxiredoxin [Planctomycetaceae bacterium]
MRNLIGFCLTAMFISGIATAAENPEVMVSVGDKAPAFEGVDQDGKQWKSAEHVGRDRYVVVYFYPADMTGGCTKQACGFRDQKARLTEAGVDVIGISGDSAENHALFRKVHDLNFTLLADQKGQIAQAFGVPLRDGSSIVRSVDGVEKTLTRGVTASRWTFIIGPDGKVIYKDTQPNAEKDSERVLAAIEKHKSGDE